MTREEAIEILSRPFNMKNVPQDILEAHRMAIKVLEQEPCEDATLKDIFCTGCEYKEQEPCENCISRQALLNVFEKEGIWGYFEQDWMVQEALDIINDLPSVGKDINVTTNEDCISRQSIKRKLQENHDFFINAYGNFNYMPLDDKSRVDEINNCIAMVVNEPSVTSKEKTGHWIDNHTTCDCCGWQMIDDVIESPNMVFFLFCPNCGARMVEQQESEG